MFAALDEDDELEALEKTELLEEEELDTLEELDEILDALLALDELIALEELTLDELIGGELEPPPPHAVSSNEKTRGTIENARVN